MEPDIEDTYRRFFPTIREKCARMLDDATEAQDVAQETFLRLWRWGPAGLDQRQVTAWIYRTSTRLAVDRMRRRLTQPASPRKREHGDEQDNPFPIDSGPDAEQMVSSRQQWRLLARAVPARELELALLARVDGLTQDEISEVAGTTARTVRRVLARFDARLEELRRKGRIDG